MQGYCRLGFQECRCVSEVSLCPEWIGDLPEQHDAHVRTYLDFWCNQLDRKIGHYNAVEKRLDDNEFDRRYGDLNA